jgi:hypothetical protein
MHVPNRFTPALCAAPGAALIAVAVSLFERLVASDRRHPANQLLIFDPSNQFKSCDFFNTAFRFSWRSLQRERHGNWRNRTI